MYKIFKNIAIVIILISFISAPSLVAAQKYKGHAPTESTIEKGIEKAARPVPRIFSSNIFSVSEGKKIDKLYNHLFVSLWLYANTGFSYQKKLYSHIKPEKFVLTRYAKEFSGDLRKAMVNLNGNYGKLQAEINAAQEEYLEIRKDIKKSDHEILDKLWQEKIAKLNKTAETYFEMDAKFLNTYKSLVGFILKQSGSYAYNRRSEVLHFHNSGAYKFFALNIDTLRNTTHDQKILLKSYIPANMDIDF